MNLITRNIRNYSVDKLFQNNNVPVKTCLLVSGLLCALTVVIYWNIFSSEFISYDDPLYILDRPQVLRGLTFESIRWALTTTCDANWIPLTWLSYLLDVSVFGVNAHAFHAVNLLIHVTNTLLLLAVLCCMTGYFWRSTVVAVLFAIHPLHVESVAWIAERKDVLSGLFFMLTLLAYHSYSIKPSIYRYVAVMILYASGLCAKSMLVTMPFLLLLLDYWPLARYSRDKKEASGVSVYRLMAEKIPLLCLAALSGVITLSVQKGAGAVVDYAESTLTENITNALVSYVVYIHKALFPLKLAVLYPVEYDIPLWQPVLAALFLSAISYCVIRYREKFPYLPVGWFWFVGMLVPVIGIIAVGSHSMADRYSYLPYSGLFIVAVWGIADIATLQNVMKEIPVAVALIVVCIFCFLTRVQVGYWHDSVKLFKHTAAVTENNYIAYENLGVVAQVRGDFQQAAIYIKESLRINPRSAGSYTTLGIIYQNLRNNNEAVICFKNAVQIDPLYAPAHFELGKNYFFNGNTGDAFKEYETLLKLDAERAESLKKIITQVGALKQLNEKL